MSGFAPSAFSALAAAAIEAAREAGAMAHADFRPGAQTAARVWFKGGNSPVTSADIAADAFLKERLTALLPEAAWLSEETADDPARLGRRLVWVVDPIDGTRAFMSGSPDWAVCVALLEAGEPALGVVHAPAHGETFAAVRGGGARRNDAPIATTTLTTLEGARVAGPKPLVEALGREARIEPMSRIPSLALRLARIAEGALDAGLVSPNSCDWDIAAADIVLREAGGRLAGAEGDAPAYNRPHPVHGGLHAAGRTLMTPLGETLRRMRTAAKAAGH